MNQRRSKFAVLVIILAVLLYLANLVIDNPYTHSLVNYYLNEKFLSKLPISAEYQSMRIQLFPPAIHLFGVKIKNKQPDPESQLVLEDLLSTSQVSLAISPWSLFLAKPQIGDLELHDLTAFWPPPQNVLDALKTLEPKDKSPTSPAQWPPKPSPPFSSMTVHNATLRMTFKGISINAQQDPNEETTLSTDGADFSIDFHGWRDIRVSSTIQKLGVWDRGSSYIEDAHLNLTGSLRGNTFRSNQMKITSPRLTTEGDIKVEIQTGKNRVVDAVSFHSTQNSDVDFSLLGSFIDLGSTFGSVSGHTVTQIDIPLAAPGKMKFLVDGMGQSRGAVLGGFHLYDSEADFKIDLDGITFKEARIKSGTKSLGKAQGRLSFNNALDYQFQAKPDHLPFDMLLGIFNVPFDVINFDLSSQNLEISGKGDPFVMSVTSDATLSNFATPPLAYSHAKFPTPPACNMRIDLKIDTTKLLYDGTQGSCYTPEIPANGSFPLIISGVTTFDDKQGMDLTLASPSEFNPGPLAYFAQVGLSGVGQTTTRIHGPYSKILIDSSYHLRDAKVFDIPLGEISAHTTVTGDRLTWERIAIHPASGGSILSPTGSISFDNDLTLDATLEASNVRPEVSRTLIASLSGNPQSTLEMSIGSLAAKIQGPLLTPARYQGSIAVALEGVRDYENEYVSKMEASITSSTKSITTTDAKVSLGSLVATVDASLTRSATIDSKFLGGIGLNADDRVSLDITAPKTSARDDQLQKLPFINHMTLEYGLRGTLSGSAKLNGNLRKLSGLAKVNVDNVQILSTGAPAITSNIILDGAKLDIIAEQGGNVLKGRMNIDLGDEALPYKWYLTCRNFDARPLMPQAFSKDPRNFAYFSGVWAMSGALSDWWQSTGELELKSTRVKYFPPRETGSAPFEIASLQPVAIEMKQAGWATRKNERFVLTSRYGSLELGMKDTKPPETLGIELNGALNLESLKSLFPGLEVATGQVQVKGSITGSVEKPEADIMVFDTRISSESASTWQPVSIGLAEYRPALKDIHFNARIGTTGLKLESFSAAKGNGTIAADGFFSFNRAASDPTDVTIVLKDAAFLYPFPIVKNFDSVVEGTVQITGAQAPLLAAGNVRIKRARSNRDIDIREAILSSIRSSGTRSGPQTLQPAMVFDLSINADETINFNSRAVQATLSTNLQLSGSDVAPEILGLIEVNKGKFFFKRDFEIRRGLINYDDPIKPDPALDISALSEVGGYKVAISITGRGSKPIMDFTVDPPTRPDGTPISTLEIITLLNRGSLPDNRIGANNTAESTAAAEALNLLAGQVEDTVQKVFDLSGQNIIRQVYIDTYASNTGEPIARFNLPLNLTEDLDLILKVDQSTVNLSSEYSLHDNISLTGGIESSNDENNSGTKRQATPADTGADIKFRFAFP